MDGKGGVERKYIDLRARICRCVFVVLFRFAGSTKNMFPFFEERIPLKRYSGRGCITSLSVSTVIGKHTNQKPEHVFFPTEKGSEVPILG